MQFQASIRALDVGTPARQLSCAVLVCLFTCLPAAAATFTVGADGACDFSDLQDALDVTQANRMTDVIYLAQNLGYHGEFVIEDQSVTLRGGYEDCRLLGTPTTTKVNRRDDSRHFRITAYLRPGRIKLERLDLIYDGSSTFRQPEGGSIHQSGETELYLINTSVRHGNADLGGGIFVDGWARLYIREGSMVANNIGIEGGGVACRGLAEVELGDDNTLVIGNSAYFGGGVHADGSCYFYSSKKHPLAGVIRNTATEDGGGIYATGRAFVQVTGNVLENSARRGGGIFLTGEDASFYAIRALIAGNQAIISGGGVHAQYGAHGKIMMDLAECADLSICGVLSDNTATRGGGVSVESGATLDILQSRIADNSASTGAIAVVNGDTSVLSIASTEIVGNRSDLMIELTDGAQLLMHHVTIGDNHSLSGEGWTLHSFPADVYVANSIYWDDDGRFHGGPSGLYRSWTCLLVPTATDDPGGSFIHVGDPDFLDEANRDFRLGTFSPAIDMCDFSGPTLDRVNNPTGVDYPWLPDWLGPYDAGAFERIE